MRNFEWTTGSPGRIGRSAAVCLLVGLTVAADEKKPAPADRHAAAGKLLTPSGSLVWREGADQPWHVAKEGDQVRTGDLLLATPLASLDVSGGVRLELVADLQKRTPFPIIETAVVLHDAAGADVDFTLDRGRVFVTNRKDQGAAQVRARFRDQAWGVRLEEPGTRVSLEIFGRWPAGAPFNPEPKPGEAPALDALFLVVSGRATLKVGAQQFLMKPAPGPAVFRWDTARGADDAPQILKAPPAWAEVGDLDASPELRQKKVIMERFQKSLVEKGVDATIEELLNSDDPNQRRLAVYAMGALDQLPRLGKALMETKHEDVWDNAVIAMRHWLGRGPGQDQKFYHFLTEVRKLPPGRAAIVLQLLHGFGEEETLRPELYEVLIEYLKHDMMGVRGLAHWHLVRLVPAGRKIPYLANGPEEEREKAYQEWKKLIPSGQMPPKASVKD